MTLNICNWKLVISSFLPSSKFVPVIVGKPDFDGTLDGTSGRKPPGPSITGENEVVLPRIPAEKSACRSVAELTPWRQLNVFCVFATDAQSGTFATKFCQSASLCSGPNVGAIALDSRIYWYWCSFKSSYGMKSLLTAARASALIGVPRRWIWIEIAPALSPNIVTYKKAVWDLKS